MMYTASDIDDELTELKLRGVTMLFRFDAETQQTTVNAWHGKTEIVNGAARSPYFPDLVEEIRVQADKMGVPQWFDDDGQNNEPAPQSISKPIKNT